eukprot:g12212.t2
MAVFSKMSGRRTAVPVVLGAAALAATSFVVPGTPVQQISARTPVAAQVKQDAVSSLPGLTAGMTMGMTAAAAAANRRKPARSLWSVAKAKKELSESGLLHLVASVQDVLSKPHEGDRMRNLKALAAELKHNQQKSTSPMEGPLRWVTNMAASLLLTQGMALQPAHAGDVINYSDFIDSVNKGDVEMVRVQPDMLSAQYITKEGARREVNLIPNAQIEDQLFNQLADKKVDVVMSTGEAGSPLDFLARFAGPLAWLVAGLLLLFGGVGGPAGPGGPGGNPFELGKSKARIIKDGDTKVKFGDVAGCDGAKTELVEVVDFLKNASRYSELGAQIPKGALLVGPPGTGKTLLAKAVAGEAGVPFFSISASEFVEVFAGVGASRVRDLFEQAKKSAPCIIFIDEIDAVGRQRSAGFGQGNDEREQTVNQLLTEMDGFESNKGVVVLAATNRADILDQALVRPGRFDRQIQVDPPDVQGRLEILKSEIDSDDIFNALERIALGLERKDAVMSEQRRRLVAYHEAGHAILGALVNDYDAVAKISIVPRGPAGGVTIFMPSEERLNSGLYSKEFLENRMCVALGGRLAEEIVNGKDNVTTGASNDFQQCYLAMFDTIRFQGTQVAKQMVMQLGMSPVIGQRQLGGQQGGPFMGRDFMGQGAPPMSQALKQQVDDEVKRIVDEQYQRGMKLLRDNMFLLDELAKLLLEQEKVSGEELVKLINRAAIEGKLAVANKQMAFAAFTGEKVDASKSSDSKLPSKCIPSMTSMASMPKGFCGSTLRSRHDRAAARNAIARLGLAGDEKIVTSEKDGAVKRVDMYDMGRTAVASVNIAGREQQLICDLPGLLFLRSRNPGSGGIPGLGNQGKAQIMISPDTGVKFENTLMAKALAGEAGVPFIQSSASEFIELFVGEMDGFEGNSGVIVVAATNRSDILDNALLRPGRFDRRVTVGLPDVKGREQILEVHIRNKKLAEGITLTEIAKRTAGFSGADLENLMNESAILAARRNKNAVTMDEINDATDRVIAGLEGRALNDNASKKLIAYHEAGHAIVGSLLPHHDPVNKVTVIPRGQAKGLTWFTPGEDQSLISAAMLKARIAGALGGRVAEQLVFGSSQVTTGAGGDLQQDLNSKIDSAIKNISDECFLTAWNLLETRRDCLDKVAEELCEMETITGDRLREIIAQYTEVPEKMAVV